MISSMATHVAQDPIEEAAGSYLASDFLRERAGRIARLADWIAGFSEFERVACNRRAVHAAVWFHDCWCCDELRAGRFAAPMVLALQPTDAQREQAADVATARLNGVIDAATLTVTARAIREAARRDTVSPEAQIVGEAVNLDSVGPLWLWGQVARCAAEDRTAASVVAVWERQIEYQYWAKRIDETLRFERSRELARHRCATTEGLLLTLRDQITGADRLVAPEAKA